MKVQNEELQQRLKFIDRTIDHAARACNSDAGVSNELRHYVNELGECSCEAQQALQSRDAGRIRESVEDLVRLSDHAQRGIRPSDGTNYQLKSAVILTHIEVSALRYRLD